VYWAAKFCSVILAFTRSGLLKLTKAVASSPLDSKDVPVLSPNFFYQARNILFLYVQSARSCLALLGQTFKFPDSNIPTHRVFQHFAGLAVLLARKLRDLLLQFFCEWNIYGGHGVLLCFSLTRRRIS